MKPLCIFFLALLLGFALPTESELTAAVSLLAEAVC